MSKDVPNVGHEIRELFDILTTICTYDHFSLKARYKQLRDLLEQICRREASDENLQMADLAARIAFLSVKHGLSTAEQNRLHTFRLTSNNILNRQEEAQRELLMRDVKTLAFLVRKVYNADIPDRLYRLLPKADATYVVRSPKATRRQRMRVSFQEADEQFLYVNTLDEVSDRPIRVRYNISQLNEEFSETCELLWRQARLNLLDVDMDEEGVFTPSFIVLEPDYLVDISALAECYKEYGSHPLNYQLAKLQQADNTRHILLGNITNFFLDEWIYADEDPDYMQTMKKVFERFPLELATCPDLLNADAERQFFADCKMHFNHIRQVVTETFRETAYHLDKSDAVLEPSYICEALGLQGRLDYMQRDMHAFIEMKSGKADEYAIKNKVTPKENNRVQMLLYQAVLEFSTGVKHNEVTPYLLYTRYPLLYPARTSWAMVKRAINLRNRIVADEYGMQLRNSMYYTSEKLAEMTADRLNQKQISGRFWEQWLRPSIDKSTEALAKLSETERAYFFALYNFIVKEQYTSKSGDTDYDGQRGASALWLSTFEQKREAGEILYDLTIVENHASNAHKPYLTFRLPDTEKEEDEELLALPNFRQGDAVILYQRENPTDNVTNKLLFKGNIESIDGEQVTMRLRASQHNLRVLPKNGRYAIEHDVMDTSFRTMYQGLSAFLNANVKRRDLLLGKRLPEFDGAYAEQIEAAKSDFERVVLKAKAAKDLFLLVGPPGTGKTSWALRMMVEEFHSQPQCNILLLSYTNRAVDEICKALTSISPEVDFIRLGSELGCDAAYRDRLIENAIVACGTRDAVRQRLQQCRIFVGTVATLSGKTDLFRLKHFEVAVVDEATQILEPQLLGLFCMRDAKGENAIEKFVFIGDHKQLPAVVLQSTTQTEVHHESLCAVGFTNLKDSLFERLFRMYKNGASMLVDDKSIASEVSEYAVDMLCRQGRMHPDVAHYANQYFYGGKLQPVGLPHQLEQWEHGGEDVDITLGSGKYAYAIPASILRIQRVIFIPSQSEAGLSCKVNHCEAHLAAHLARHIYACNKAFFEIGRTLGIIAPYRNQIALIRRELAIFNIDALNHILIDTVERFQGSERDVIIYSLCINRTSQLNQTSNILEEDGVVVDRKLNVALTRARKQILILGDKDKLLVSKLHADLINFTI